MSAVEQSPMREFAPIDAYEDAPAPAVTLPKVTVKDFVAYMPEHRYVFVPARDLWPGSSVNARCATPTNADGTPATKTVKRTAKGGAERSIEIEVSPTEWLDENAPVDQMTWAPGYPLVIPDKLVSAGGWVERPGCSVFNLYREPQTEIGDPDQAGPWLEHIRNVYPAEAAHILPWLAHRVQRPGEKINHALVFGGAQGIGKDTLLEPIKYAVGPWNFAEVGPQHLLGRFNGFLKSVILRVSEARDLGDVDRFSFYDHMKTLTAAPPDVLRVDEKNIREYSVMNVCGVIITSNHKTDGIYLPPDDRRHFVAWSHATREDFDEKYWNSLYRWYQAGGNRHVTAYLAAYDLGAFDSKAPPPKTAAWHEIVDANRAPEDAELADVIDALGGPNAITIADLTIYAGETFGEWLKDIKSRRQIPHRLESVGYAPVRNECAKDGLWKVAGKRQTIYVKAGLAVREQVIEASRRARGEKL